MQEGKDLIGLKWLSFGFEFLEVNEVLLDIIHFNFLQVFFLANRWDICSRVNIFKFSNKREFQFY